MTDFNTNVNSTQVGGNHYRNDGQVQHWDFIEYNGLRYLEGCATKYITRCRKKHKSPIQDLEKSLHYIDKLIDLFAKEVIKPRATPTPISVEEFAAAAKLNDMEMNAIMCLTHWQTLSDLEDARKYVATMIHNQQSKDLPAGPLPTEA